MGRPQDSIIVTNRTMMLVAILLCLLITFVRWPEILLDAQFWGKMAGSGGLKRAHWGFPAYGYPIRVIFRPMTGLSPCCRPCCPLHGDQRCLLGLPLFLKCCLLRFSFRNAVRPFAPPSLSAAFWH